MGRGRALFWTATILVCVSCSPVEPGPTDSAVPSRSGGGSSAPAASASFDPADIARWVAFRETYGLPSSPDWVSRVARDPTSTSDFDVPLLPTEIDIVARQNRAAQDLMPAVIAYGERFHDYGGARIEGTKAVILFSDGLEEHQQTLDRLFGSGRIEVRRAPYSIADLEEKGASIVAERDWFTWIGVELVDADPDELTNTVELRYIAPNRSAEPAILDHFGHADWLSVHWEGPPPWTGPWGRLVVKVVDSAGRRLPAEANPHCTPTPVESSVRYDPGVATGTDVTGTCIFDRIPAVRVRYRGLVHGLARHDEDRSPTGRRARGRDRQRDDRGRAMTGDQERSDSGRTHVRVPAA